MTRYSREVSPFLYLSRLGADGESDILGFQPTEASFLKLMETLDVGSTLIDHHAWYHHVTGCDLFLLVRQDGE
jgi:hypothetical protein